MISSKNFHQFHSFAYGYPIVPALFIEKIIFFPSWNGLGTLVENHLTMYVRFSFETLILFHCCMCLFMPVPHYFDYCIFVVNFESWSMSPSALFFCFRIVLALLGTLIPCMSLGWSFPFLQKISLGCSQGLHYMCRSVWVCYHLNDTKSSNPWTLCI